MNSIAKKSGTIAVLSLLGVAAYGAYDLSIHIESAGGGVSGNGTLQVSGSMGQPVAGVSFGDSHDLESGFWYTGAGAVSDVSDGTPELPRTDRIDTPFPNPFNPSTTISFELAARGPVRVRIFDTQGRMVRDLVRAEYPAGRHEVTWDGRNDQGGGMPSGVYFLRFDASETSATRKMTLLK